MAVRAKLPSSIDATLEVKPESSSALSTSIRRLRAEANLVRFPFFDLSREAKCSKRDVLEVRETKRGEDGLRVETIWTVERSFNSLFPGELARRIHREVVERAISEVPRPVKNPIFLGSFRDICEKLNIKIGGRTAKQIQAALISIVSATVHSKSTFYLKSSKRYLQEAFHLYEGVAFAGDPLPDGRVADAVYVNLASWYLENINANYVAPLDFEYFRRLKGSIASRMYELLHHWFFVGFRSNQAFVERRYSTLCAYFPLARQDTLWKAKKQLRDAHNQHQASGYLASLPEWRPIHGSKKDWTLVYKPGQKACDEYRRNHSRRDHDGLSPDELPLGPQFLLPPVTSCAPSELQRDLVRELEVHGVTHDIALALVKAHAPELIQQKLEAFQWLMAKSERPITTNPAGYLRTSIEKNYAPPEGFVPAAERQRQAAEKAARSRAAHNAEAQAARDRQHRATAIETLWNTLSPAARSSLETRAESTLPPFARQALARERLEDRRSGTGHFALRAEIEKLLAAELDS